MQRSAVAWKEMNQEITILFIECDANDRCTDNVVLNNGLAIKMFFNFQHQNLFQLRRVFAFQEKHFPVERSVFAWKGKTQAKEETEKRICDS